MRSLAPLLALALLLPACAVATTGTSSGYDGAATTLDNDRSAGLSNGATTGTERRRAAVAGLTADGDSTDRAEGTDGSSDPVADAATEADPDTAAGIEAGGTIVAHAVSDAVTARSGPNNLADEIERFSNPTERGGPLVFMALGEPTDGWIKVLLPVRPNGTTGWIPVDDVELTINPFAIEIDVDEHRMTILRFGEERLSTEVAIGTGATPTPIGEFYLVELLRPSNPAGAYGPFAYGLSGFSETLESFNGGEGIIGIHGTNQPDLIGQDVSHGCIRVPNPTVEEMAAFLPLGTPVRIHRDDPDDETSA